MKTEYSAYKNIMMLNPIYDALEINLLRSNCKIYIHGHSAGGTNPSLVEAMNLHLPIITYGVVYNRETTENQALYFEDAMYAIARRRYLWSIICMKYERLFL